MNFRFVLHFVFKKMKIIVITFLFFSHSALAQVCDSSRRPIVFVHGFLASGDTWAGQIQRFVERGYCSNRLFVFDWNSVGGKKTDSLLDAFINNVLQITGSKQIDLIGHSAGGGLGRGYLIDSAYAAKVAHYIHIGSRKWFTASPYFANSKCLNIYSTADMVMGKAGGDVEGANNLSLKNQDHYEVATSMETFESICRFINADKCPSIITHSPDNISVIDGKAVVLGSNEPLGNAFITVYEMDEKTGMRTKKLKATRTDTAGKWGPLLLSAKKRYEIELEPEDENDRVISYFFEPFKRNNAHVYLRGFPKGNMVAQMLGNLPASDSQSVIVIYSSSKAIIAGRDSLTVNGVPVSSPTLTPASKTIISSFIYDDGDGKTSGKALRQYGVAPFLGGVDISLPANKNSSHIIYFNGRTIAVPAVSSKEKILLAVFN